MFTYSFLILDGINRVNFTLSFFMCKAQMYMQYIHIYRTSVLTFLLRFTYENIWKTLWARSNMKNKSLHGADLKRGESASRKRKAEVERGHSETGNSHVPYIRHMHKGRASEPGDKVCRPRAQPGQQHLTAPSGPARLLPDGPAGAQLPLPLLSGL